jgi:hypothetical protein
MTQVRLKYDWTDLRHLYDRDKLSTVAIAELKGCSKTVVVYHLRKQGIKPRDIGEAQRLAIERGRRVIKDGSNSPSWKGGKLNAAGYILVYLKPSDFFYPMATKSGYVREHRLVVAQKLGRCLQPWEKVHHKDGIRTHNDYSNLELTTDGRHSKEHGKGYRDGYRQGSLDGQTAIFNPLKLQNDALLQQIKLLRWQLKEREESKW